MIPLERCRQLLDGATELTDEQLETLREQLYALAGVAVELASETPAGDGKPAFGGVLDVLSVDERDAVLERAAIREFDGGQERDDAERGAVVDFLTRHEQEP